MNKSIFAASNIAIAEKSNDIFLFVTMRLLSTRVNRNKDAVTEEFIDEIIDNQETYNGLPVYVDTARLLAGDYDSLGHMYNRMTGKFKTTQVGSLCHFEKVEDEYGTSLIAEARFPKRETAICDGIMDLYENGALNFSFEISYMPDAVRKEDGVLYIQADEHNVLTGLAIVSVPAYEEAVALSLVAEDESATQCSESAAEQEGVEKMNDEMNVEVVAEVEETVAAETEEAVAEETNAEETVVAEEVQPEAVNAETEEAPAETEQTVAENVMNDDMVEHNDPDLVAAHAALEAEAASLRATIAQLYAQIEVLNAEHAELEAIRAERKAQELANRQNTARSFAEKQGLDPEAEEVASAIAELNFEKLAELAMQKEEPKENEAVEAIASVDPMVVEEKSLRERLFENDL